MALSTVSFLRQVGEGVINLAERLGIEPNRPEPTQRVRVQVFIDLKTPEPGLDYKLEISTKIARRAPSLEQIKAELDSLHLPDITKDYDYNMAHNGGTPSPQPDINRNRLPTLFEVLSRRTRPPVDLFSFYIYMRDQQKSVDYLDFWYAILHVLKFHMLTSTGLMLLSTCHFAAIMFVNFDDRS